MYRSFIALVIGVYFIGEFVGGDGVAVLVEFVEVIEVGSEGSRRLEVGEVFEAAC